MLYSEKELNKRLKSGCELYFFYAADEALVRNVALKAEAFFRKDDPESTVLEGPNPSVEEVIAAAGTISFFGGKRLVLMPMLQPSRYSDRDLDALCETLAETENAVMILTCVVEESYGRLRPGKREQRLIAACEKLGYCVQINKPDAAALREMVKGWAADLGAQFVPGAEQLLIERCGEDQFLLENEVQKLAAYAGYLTITKEMVQNLSTVTLEADVFDLAKILLAGNTTRALQKLNVLLALQSDPIAITGALISNYLDVYRVLLAQRSHRSLADVAKDFHYTGKWQYRLENAGRTASRCRKEQLERCLYILQQLDLDLKRSRLDRDMLMQKALCELALAGRRS